MKEKIITEKLKTAVGSQLDLRPEGSDRFYVSTPFRYEDGDHLEIYLKVNNGRVFFTDEGLTMMKLSYDVPEYDKAGRNKIIERILTTEHVANSEGILSLETNEGNLGPAFLSFIEAILRVSDISFLKREIVKSIFMDEFRAFIEQSVEKRHMFFDRSFSEIDPNGTYPIDCVVQNGAKPLFMFAVTTDDKCKDATITIHHYERHHFDFRSMAVFEDQETISRTVLARLTDVCDRQFSNLPGNKDRILEHILQVTG